MLSKLLFICFGVFPLLGRGQSPATTNGLPPVDSVTIDSTKTITELSSFITDKSKVGLSWNVKGDLPDFFTIERSDNGKPFEVVTVLNNPEKRLYFLWTDDQPKKGRSFYRIKYSFGPGPDFYSPTVNVAFSGYIDYKFYPNPVDHILIVRCDSPIDVHISDANGKIRIAETKVSGLHTINVSSLEKGIYLIRFSSKLTNVISQEKLIKN